jgi:hypothetical protein
MRNLVIRAVILFWAGGVLGSLEEPSPETKINSRISKWHAIIPLVGLAAAAILAKTSFGTSPSSSVISLDKAPMNVAEGGGVVSTSQQLSGLNNFPSVLKGNTDSSDMAVPDRIFATPEEEVESALNSNILSQGWGAYEPVLKAYFAAMAGKEVNEKIAYLESDIANSSEKGGDDVSILKNAVAQTLLDELKSDQVVRRNQWTREYLVRTKDMKSPTQKFNYYKEQMSLVDPGPDSNEKKEVLSQLMTAEQRKVAKVKDAYYYETNGLHSMRPHLRPSEHASILGNGLFWSYVNPWRLDNYDNNLDREGRIAAIAKFKGE